MLSNFNLLKGLYMIILARIHQSSSIITVHRVQRIYMQISY